MKTRLSGSGSRFKGLCSSRERRRTTGLPGIIRGKRIKLVLPRCATGESSIMALELLTYQLLMGLISSLLLHKIGLDSMHSILQSLHYSSKIGLHSCRLHTDFIEYQLCMKNFGRAKVWEWHNIEIQHRRRGA